MLLWYWNAGAENDRGCFWSTCYNDLDFDRTLVDGVGLPISPSISPIWSSAGLAIYYNYGFLTFGFQIRPLEAAPGLYPDCWLSSLRSFSAFSKSELRVSELLTSSYFGGLSYWLPCAPESFLEFYWRGWDSCIYAAFALPCLTAAPISIWLRFIGAYSHPKNRKQQKLEGFIEKWKRSNRQNISHVELMHKKLNRILTFQ